MQFEIALDLKDTRGQLPIDIERLSPRAGEQEGDPAALFVTNQESRRSASAQAADRATAVDLACRRSHYSKEALGVHELSDEPGLPQGDHRRRRSQGSSDDCERFRPVELDHGNSVSSDKGACEADVLAILPVHGIGRPRFS